MTDVTAATEETGATEGSRAKVGKTTLQTNRKDATTKVTKTTEEAKMHKLKYLTLILTAIIASACTENVVFQASKSMPKGIWVKDNIVNFNFEWADTTGSYDVVIDIRNQNNYPFQNFWLFANLYNPDGEVYRDTLNCVLADNSGRWIGEGMGSVHHLPVSFIQDARFQKSGKYRLELIQGMRTDSLKGISDIGIRICLSNNINNKK